MELHVVMQLFGDAFLGHTVAIKGHAIDIDEDADQQNKNDNREQQIDFLMIVAHEERVKSLVQALNALLLHVHFIGLHEHQWCFIGRDEG